MDTLNLGRPLAFNAEVVVKDVLQANLPFPASMKVDT